MLGARVSGPETWSYLTTCESTPRATSGPNSRWRQWVISLWAVCFQTWKTLDDPLVEFLRLCSFGVQKLLRRVTKFEGDALSPRDAPLSELPTNRGFCL